MMKIINKRIRKYLNNQTFIIVLLLIFVIIISSIFYTNYYKNQPIQIKKEFLYKILTPGKYLGTSYFEPTNIYKNGLKSKHVLVIKKNNNGLEVTNNQTAYDAKTGKLEYIAKRHVIFFYKINHKNDLFKSSHSYIDDKLVSSSYGYATGQTENSIIFHLSGSWYIDNRDFHKITSTITRNSANSMSHTVEHPNLFGFNSFTMKEKYTLQ